MTPTQIRTAPHMRLKAEQAVTKYNQRDIHITSVELYNRGEEWYIVGYYNDGDEYSVKLDDSTKPGGWMDAGQFVNAYVITLN